MHPFPPRGDLVTLRGSETAMHYPHRISRIKKVRKIGFRARMKTSKGRAILNRKRRVGRKIQVR
jgi:large subunit ribosomal protein L34